MAITELRRPTAPAVRPGPQARRPARPRGELVATGLLAIGLLTALAGFHVVLAYASWYAAGVAFVLLVLVSATIARRLVRRRWLPTVIAAVVALLGLTVGYAADRALLGIIPTPDVFGRFNRLTEQAWLSIAEQSIPATPELGIVFLLALLCIGCALFGELVIRRAPALTAIPLLTLLAVPVAVRGGIADPFWYAATAVVFLLLLRRGQWRASAASIVLAGAVVVVGSLVAPLLLPPVQEAPEPTGTGVETGINPLINLGDDLRRGSAVTAVSYTTSSDQGVYLRLATLDTFTGRTWAPSSTQPSSKNTIDEFPPPVGLTPAVERKPLTADLTVGNITGRWLPIPYPASSVKGLTGTWNWEPNGLSVHSPDTSASNQTYGVSFLDVEPNLSQLRAAGTNGTVQRADLALPDGMPSIIAETAQEVTASATTEYDRALALQDYFTTTGGFSYSETAPVEQGYDGTGAQIIAQFLQKKAGYCVHFASSMAVMARTLGIPSRVAVGFQPGSPSLENGKTVFTVSSHDLHAWPELYFEGIGWLRFEPTPGRGELPVYSTPSAVDDSISQDPGSTASDAPAPSASSTPGASTDRPGFADQPVGTGGSANGGLDVGVIVVLALLALLVLIAIAPAVMRVGIRMSRERAMARGRDPAAAAWAEVRDTARDHGWAAPDTETARDFANRLTVVLADDRQQIDGFRTAIERAAYAERPAEISLDELRAVRRSIAASVDAKERLRAIFLPPSLVARLRGFDAEA